MTRELAAEMVRGMAEAGATRIFGMPGGGPNLDMIGCAEEAGMEFVLAHGETAACLMAATHGRLTGTPGVALVTRGPGLASALNGLAAATLDRSPLLLVSDTVTAEQAPRVDHQRVDQVAAARPLAKWSGTLGHADPAAVAAAAARLARVGPAGGVHLAFDPTTPGDPAPVVPASAGPAAEQLGALRSACAGATHPVVVLGLDAARHGEAVRDALAELECPVLTTYEAKGVLPERDCERLAGLFTGGTVERALLERADLVLGVGLDAVEPMPGPFPYDAPVVLLHTHATPVGYFGQPHVAVGPYEDTLPAALAEVRSAWDPGAGRRVRRANVELLDHDSDGMGPLEVVRTVQGVHPDAVVTVDSGAHMLVVMPLWEATEHDQVLISNGLATMGFALPAAIGAALARPGRRVVAFTGDGGLGMALAELETLARLRLDVCVVVLNDAALTLIELKQQQAQGGAGAVAYGTTDFAGVAAAMGLPATRVDDAGDLHRALAGAGPGPCLVDARIDASGYRHVLHSTRG